MNVKRAALLCSGLLHEANRPIDKIIFQITLSIESVAELAEIHESAGLQPPIVFRSIQISAQDRWELLRKRSEELKRKGIHPLPLMQCEIDEGPVEHPERRNVVLVDAHNTTTFAHCGQFHSGKYFPQEIDQARERISTTLEDWIWYYATKTNTTENSDCDDNVSLTEKQLEFLLAASECGAKMGVYIDTAAIAVKAWGIGEACPRNLRENLVNMRLISSKTTKGISLTDKGLKFLEKHNTTQ